MKINLKQLSLLNFKGIQKLDITLNGSTNIYAANRVGKSTIYTAFAWLLTGKDEFDRKDFEIKNTKDKSLNKHPHEVEGVLDIDGTEYKLKRVYLERWERVKGEDQPTFKGHKTKYFFNDVPCNETEYLAKVQDIIDLKLIKLLTNAHYFNALEWEQQRKGLLSIAGEISRDEIINSIATPENDYSTLVMVLNSGKTAQEWKTQIAAKKLLLKKSASEFAPRIDEVQRSKPEPLEWAAIQSEIDTKQTQVDYLDKLISSASQALAEKQKGIIANQKLMHEKVMQVANIRQRIKTEYTTKQNAGNADINNIQSEITTATNKLKELEKRVADNAHNKEFSISQIEIKRGIVNKLRAEWDLINAEKFDFDETTCACPTCKQQLPAGDIEAKKAELLKNFVQSVTDRKKEKVDYSNQVKAEIEQLQKTVSNIEVEDNSNGPVIVALEQNIDELNKQLADLKNKKSDKPVVDTELAVDKLMALDTEALNLGDEIEVLKKSIADETELLETDNKNENKESRSKFLNEITLLKNQLLVKTEIEKADARIEVLKNEERVNAQALADLENQEIEADTYTRAWMNILQTKVNKLFKFVKFRLFEEQVNGGIANTCVCELDGVPYPTLNTESKLLAGLDVLNTFSNYYKIHAPVFCDNRESVTNIPESQSQIISLFVSPTDSEIRIEPAI